MKKNVGSIDKAIRFIIALVMVLLYALDIVTGVWGYVALGVAAIMVITSLISFCGLYALIGVNTCKTN